MSRFSFIKGWSGYDFAPEIFYIDFADKIDDNTLEEYCIDNDTTINDNEKQFAIDDIKINRMFLFIDSLLETAFIKKLGFISTFNKSYEILELATNKEIGVKVIGSTADTLVVTWKFNNGQPLTYFPVAFVPVVKFEDLYQILFDAEFKNHEAIEEKGNEYSSYIQMKTFKLYKKSIRQFNHEWKSIFNKINKYYSNGKKRQHISKQSDIFGYMPKQKVKKNPNLN